MIIKDQLTFIGVILGGTEGPDPYFFGEDGHPTYKSQITRLQQIQNSSFLALLLKLLGLSAIEYKFLSLTVITYKVLTAISNLQLSSLFNVLIVLALHLSLLLLAHQHHPLQNN